MFLYLIFINLICSTIQTDFIILIDELFKSHFQTKYLSIDKCKQYNSDSFYYRGKPTNIKDIIDSKKTKNLNYYDSVYIPEIKYFDNITLFPKSTIFFVSNNIATNSSLYKENYCYMEIEWELSNKSFYYIIAGKDEHQDLEDILIGLLVVFFLIVNILLLLLNIKICCLKPFQQIYVYDFARSVIAISNVIALSCTMINYYLLPYMMFSFYKAYIITHLIFFIDGFMVLHYDYLHTCGLLKFLFLFFLFDSLISLFFIYIIYFIPSVDNFFLLLTKNCIYHLVIFIYAIKSFITKLIPLYRQYKFEESLRNFFAIGYKAKLIIYLKIIIFSLIYCSLFFILPFVEIWYSLHRYTKGFYFVYYINTAFEMFLAFIIAIIFFPSKITFFYYLPIYYDFDSRTIITKISKENKKINNISNLTKEDLKKKYVKENLPIVFIGPFFSINNYFNNNISVGIVEQPN